MHQRYLFSLLLLFLFLGCSRKKETECPAPQPITFITTPSDRCKGTGSLNISAPTGGGFLYSIDGVSYRTIPHFDSLLAKDYMVEVVDQNGCIGSVALTVNHQTAGGLFLAVKELLAAKCAPCHSGNNPQAGLNWTADCDILQHWQRIRARAVEGDPAPMPPSGLIAQAERDKITDWINAGHRYTD